MSLPMAGVRRIFLDSAPVIYFVEQHPVYHSLLQPIFNRFETGEMVAVTSPVTLAECLIFPVKLGDTEAIDAFLELLGGEHDTVLVTLGRETARLAAEIRSRYNVTLTDAFQVASAIEGACDIMLTNDKALTRVSETRIQLVEDL
jgi:predicted nucleic acid-binding protein